MMGRMMGRPDMRLPDIAVLKGAIERLVANHASSQDREEVRAALAAGALSIATGQRAVAVGGSVNDTIIVTGDGAVVIHVDVSGAAAIDRLLQRSHPSPLHQLPADVADFVGRGTQMEKLLGVLSVSGGRAAISAIAGMGGLGKTTLAVHVAHRLAERYPDGQIVVDMAATGASPLSPGQGLAWIIRAFEPVMQLPDTVAELRPIFLSALRGKRVLLILDDAQDGNQVTPLLPPEDCALIITSRRRIAVAGLERVDLDLLALDEATGLLASIAGEGRATVAELSLIAELCGLLPLALRVAGMFLVASPHWSATEFIDALADERERLLRLKLDGNAILDVAASLALSVGELRRTRPDIADLWHELAVFPTSFDTDAASAVWDQPPEPARDVLGLLLSRSMLIYDTAQQRWRVHDLMRDLAGGHIATKALGASADLAARLTKARRRHAEHYQHVLEAADHIYIMGGAHMLSGLALFDRERPNIETGQAWATSNATEDLAAARLCLSYSNGGARILDLRHHPHQRISWLETAAVMAREIGDQAAETSALSNLGGAYADLGDSCRAIEFYERGLVIAREIGDRSLQGNALGNLGNAYRRLGYLDRAIEHLGHVLAIAREIGDRRIEAITLNNVGLAYADQGDSSRAMSFYGDALRILREIGDLRSVGMVLGNLGLAHAARGDFRGAIKFYEQNLAIARRIGDRAGEGAVLGSLGVAHKNLGELPLAIERHEQALTIAREIGDRYREGDALGNLGLAYAALGEPSRPMDFLRGALEIFEAIESPHAAQARATIAKLEKEGGT